MPTLEYYIVTLHALVPFHGVVLEIFYFKCEDAVQLLMEDKAINTGVIKCSSSGVHEYDLIAWLRETLKGCWNAWRSDFVLHVQNCYVCA